MKMSSSPLVTDGNTVRLRLEAERQFTRSLVHIDWVRFTCMLKNAPVPSAAVLFPESKRWDSVHAECQGEQQQHDRIVKTLRELPDADFAASAQAFELASRSASALGSAFSVDPEHKKGIDFYKFRWSILLNEHEVGWVGFLSSSDSMQQNRQNSTIHVNLMGTACTFAAPGWNQRIAELIDDTDAVLTRADLALDFFDGYQGGIEAVRIDYRDGLCNSHGRKLKFNMVGDWENGHDRSLYIGSREAGKITNVYEKGDQLFGEKAGSEWLRFELRYGNKLRVFTSDLLRRPDDFFAGASEWHHSVLLRAGSVPAPECIRTKPRLQLETVQAECSRNLRWLMNTAASTMAVAVKYLDESDLMALIGHAKLPGRLRKFAGVDIAQCFSGVSKAVVASVQAPVVMPVYAGNALNRYL